MSTHNLKTLLTLSILSIFTIFAININIVSAVSLKPFYDSVIYLGDEEVTRDELPSFEAQNYCDPKIYIENPKLEILQIRDDYIEFKCSEYNEESGNYYNVYIANFKLLINKNQQSTENQNIQVFNSPICKDTKTCNGKHYINYNLGYLENQNTKQKEDNLNFFCQKSTENEKSKAISYEIGSSDIKNIFFLFKNNSGIITYGVNNNNTKIKYYSSVTCSLEEQKVKTPGCTNPQSLNYNSEANEDDGSCIAKIEGCTDSLATNYDPQANVHEEQSCVYPPDNQDPQNQTPYTPKDITGYIENTQVQSGSTTFNLTLNLNTTGSIIDISKIQIWNQFTPINSVTQDNKIIITFQKFNGQRLDVECTSYELTIPKNSITRNLEIIENSQTKQIIEKNSNPITGNFTVVGCKNNNNQDNQDNQNPNTQNNDIENQDQENQNKSTIKENGFYISIFDTDENGKQYINLTNTIYLLGFITFFLFLFFLFFSFLKNSFLGAKRR